MVDKALVLENHRGVMERKHKLVHQHQPGSSSRPCVATSLAGPVFCSAQPEAAGQGFCTPQCQVIQRPNNLQTPTVESHSVQKTQATQDPQQDDRRCYNYGEKGHFINRSSNSRTCANQPATATPVPTRGANSITVATKQNYAHGRVNYVAVEEA
jgi:hypothetical protein